MKKIIQVLILVLKWYASYLEMSNRKISLLLYGITRTYLSSWKKEKGAYDISVIVEQQDHIDPTYRL